MSKARKHRTAKEIFSLAVEYYEPHQWEAYLVDACGDDLGLRQRVRELLEAHQQCDSLLDHNAERTDPLVITEHPGAQIGPYKLLQQIGEGGFGVVYMAEQQEPVRRKVALKIIKPGMDTKQVIARFEAERQALAMMDHPNIAKVLDAGATDSGRPYFVMELVKGIPITEFCDSNRLPARDRLELFAAVCQAVQHAHQKGVIHRDLKPNNVMVTLHDNKPMPVVIDFGVSKAISHQLTERTLFTAYGQMVGTPAYMSPEQAQMSRMDIDTRSDVYSLGVMLYELLTGGTPLDAEQLRGTAYAEMQRLIREEEAPKPSTRLSTSGNALAKIAQDRGTNPRMLGQFIRGDLDWIVLKALEKERNRRYESASNLANDIHRFLNDEAIAARPPSITYQMRKFVGRHRGLVTAGVAVSAAVILGVIGTSIGMVQARRDAARARAAMTKAEQEKQRANVLANEKRVETERAVAVQREAEHQRNEAERQRQHAEAVVGLLGEMIGSADPDDRFNPQFTVLELLDSFSAKLDERLHVQPAVEATVRLMLSDVYNRFRTNTDQGLRHAQRAYELFQELHGQDHDLTVRAERDLAIHMLFASDSRKQSQGRERLEMIIDANPPLMQNDPVFAIRTKNAALLTAWPTVRHDEYPELLRETEDKLGHDHRQTISIRSNYARDLIGARDYEQAESLLRDAIESLTRTSALETPLAVIVHNGLARVLIARGDDGRASQILLPNLQRATEHLGAGHMDTIATLRSLMQVLDRQDKSDLAEETFTEFSNKLRRSTEVSELATPQWLARNAEAARGTPAGTKLVDLAAELLFKAMDEGTAESASQVNDALRSLTKAAIANQRLKLVARVVDVAWDTYGADAPSLGITYSSVLRSTRNREAAVDFLTSHTTPDSSLFRLADGDRDGELSPQELVTLIGPRLVSSTDTNGDEQISEAEAGQPMWSLLAKLDENADGFVDRREYSTMLLGSQFVRGDANADGFLTEDESIGILRGGARFTLTRLDQDGDGKLSRAEFVNRPLSRRRDQNLTLAERFARSDVDGDERVTATEANPALWQSVSEFDVNDDGAVSRDEFEQGSRYRKQQQAERFFANMDRNADGQADRDEIPALLWERWHTFDADGDQRLDKEEFMKSQLDQSQLDQSQLDQSQLDQSSGDR